MTEPTLYRVTIQYASGSEVVDLRADDRIDVLGEVQKYLKKRNKRTGVYKAPISISIAKPVDGGKLVELTRYAQDVSKNSQIAVVEQDGWYWLKFCGTFDSLWARLGSLSELTSEIKLAIDEYFKDK